MSGTVTLTPDDAEGLAAALDGLDLGTDQAAWLAAVIDAGLAVAGEPAEVTGHAAGLPLARVDASPGTALLTGLGLAGPGTVGLNTNQAGRSINTHQTGRSLNTNQAG